MDKKERNAIEQIETEIGVKLEKLDEYSVLQQRLHPRQKWEIYRFSFL